MKNLINRDFEKLQTKTATVESMIRQNKKLPYERVLLVNSTGKYSSKQCDQKRKVSHAKYLRRRSTNLAEKAMEAEHQLLTEESLMLD